MTPKTPMQNMLIWGAALLLSLAIAFCISLPRNWPETGAIDWRGIILDIAAALATILPVVGAGLGLPTIGKERVANLVSEVGTSTAKAALEVEAVKQATGLPPATTPSSVDDIADQIVAKIEARMKGTAAP